MCFRKLAQNVPAWDQMLRDTSNTIGTFPDQLGARLIGRWKSGCPVAKSVDFDNKTIAADPKQVNNFTYVRGEHLASPAGAHIRKTFPRGDLADSVLERSRILRRGIPYGNEISADPTGERGLLFVCYQSNLANGYQFIQQTWANNETFFDANAGLDITIGQSNTDSDGLYSMQGLMPSNLTRPASFKTINQFVVPKGGEYFFMPSMTALKTTLAGRAKAEL
jgi:Dyp-type peroxidase family